MRSILMTSLKVASEASRELQNIRTHLKILLFTTSMYPDDLNPQYPEY